MRVLIVDDHTLVRAGIGRLLQALPDVDVVAEACNGQQALDMAAIHRPDLILLDLSLPDRSGLELLPLLRDSLPQTRVVMMSMHNDPTQVRVALDRGCAGFVVKEAAPMELELALRAAANGQVFLSPQVSSKMLAPMLNQQRPTGIAALSPRQREILRQLRGDFLAAHAAAPTICCCWPRATRTNWPEPCNASPGDPFRDGFPLCRVLPGRPFPPLNRRRRGNPDGASGVPAARPESP